MPQPLVTAVLLITSLWMPVLQEAQVRAIIQYHTFITCLFHLAQCLEGSSRTQQVPEPTSWSRLKIFHSPLPHVAHAFISKQRPRVASTAWLWNAAANDHRRKNYTLYRVWTENYKIIRQFHVWFWLPSPHCFPLRALFLSGRQRCSSLPILSLQLG